MFLEEDTLPKKICTKCCTSLEAYTQFKDSVVDAQDKLAAIARSIEKSQEQSIIQLRSRQYLKSPKRPKLYSSSAHTPPSGSHVLVPAPSFLCGDNDLDDPSIECDEPPSSVVSSEDEESPTNAKVVPECSSAVEVSSKDEDVQEPVQGSPPRPSVKQVSSSATASLSPPEINHSNSHQPDQADIVSGTVNMNSVGTIECDEETVEVEAHLVCGICSVKVNDRDLLISHHTKQHSSKSNKDPVFGCSVCSRISSNYDAIRQHIYRHRMLGAFKCADCDKSYSTKDQLDVHISSKHNPAGSKAFSCSLCGKLYSTNMALAAHTKKKHQNTISPSKQDNSSNSKVTIIGASNKPNPSESLPASIHVSTSNTEQQNHQSSSSSSLQTKVTDSLNMQSSVSQSQSSCSNDIQQDANALSETNKDEKDGYWKCGYCEKILYSKHGYETHVAVHKGRRFTCEYCGVSYTQKPTLEHHIKVHHTNVDKDFECPECKKNFKTFRQLGWHKKTHEKPLSDVKCPQCDKKFLNMISLKTHMKLHRGSKNFPCPECPKSFYTKQKQEEHMNSHTGRRPFGCPTESCTKVFSCFSNYAKHFKKHHHDLVGPRGSMIPQPKMIETNNNSDSCKSNNSLNTPESLKTHVQQVPQALTVTVVTPIIRETGVTTSLSPSSKSQPVATTSSNSTSLQPLTHISTSTSTDVPLGATMTSSISQQTPMSLSITKPTVLIFPNASNSNVCNQSVQTSSLSSTTAATQAHSGCLPLVTSNNSSGHGHTLTLHSSNISTNENPSHHHQSSSQHQSVLTHGGSSSAHGQSQPQAHHHSANNVHSSHSVHAHQPPHNSAVQTQHISQLQQHNPVQSVWQPVILPGSKNFHHGNSSSLPSLSSSLDLMDCAGTITAHQSDSVSGANHSHGHPGNLNVIQMHAATAHHSTPSHPSHLHHSINSSSNNGHHHLHPSHHSSHSHPSNSLPSSHNNIGSSSASTVTVPTFVPSSQQNEPMELSYKLDSNNFQEMPMELTKVFTQRDPLELCVRQEFAQPGMDLSSRVVNVTVGGNPSISVSSMSMNMNGSSNNPNSYGAINSGGGSSSTSTVLSVPYHKTVEMVERELSLNDFTGAFRQPIDLIARTDEQSHELCSEGNLVDLSLRSSFGQDHSASSFLRELIDLSSRETRIG
ncbi:putative zinc finger protein [Orchesella cincta]|uniref:Putative zinc finger protein n=1 Tax=Orchesella cincta TaxID=48709 RepID=A0A1D2MVI7_ORCCI|nr:putative zinc finger protein [Orchesella cincta]